MVRECVGGHPFPEIHPKLQKKRVFIRTPPRVSLSSLEQRHGQAQCQAPSLTKEAHQDPKPGTSSHQREGH